MAKFETTSENLALARAIVLEGWMERAKERGNEPVRDASGSCKFASLFFKELFGGQIKGHYDHQFNVVNGQHFDLNEDCEDVIALAVTAPVYWHDKHFFGNPDHKESMASCMPRVRRWVNRFKAQQQVILNKAKTC